VAVDGLDLNVPDGNLTGLVVTRPGEPVRPRRREKVMSIIDEALSANATIASGYDPARGKPPAPRIAIVTCADPRLTGIGQMLGLADGDVDMIRNAAA
jgi:hypothetical protein